MQSPVKLYLRVRFPDGSHPFLKAAFASNGRIRPNYAMHAGKAISFPSSSYYLRYQSNGKRVWEPAGDDASLAMVNLQRKVHALEGPPWASWSLPLRASSRPSSLRLRHPQSNVPTTPSISGDSAHQAIYLHPGAYAEMLRAVTCPEVDSRAKGTASSIETTCTIEGVVYALAEFASTMRQHQARMPRSKKRRIQNKWATDPRNWKDENVAYLVDRSKPFLRPQLISNFARPYWTPEAPIFQGLARLVGDRSREMGR